MSRLLLHVPGRALCDVDTSFICNIETMKKEHIHKIKPNVFGFTLVILGSTIFGFWFGNCSITSTLSKCINLKCAVKALKFNRITDVFTNHSFLKGGSLL